MCTFGLSGCRVNPRQLRGTFQREGEKKENCGGRREKKTRNFGLPTLRGPTLRGPTLRGPTLRGPTFSRFGAPPFEGPTLCRPKIQHPKIGRSRNWPKSKLAEVELAELEKKAGRSRNWPKSIALVCHRLYVYAAIWCGPISGQENQVHFSA